MTEYTFLTAADIAAASGAGAVGFNPAGTIEATDVQAAIEELDTEVYAAIAALSSVYQPLDADLTAIAALASTGLLNRTGAATFGQVEIATGSWTGAFSFLTAGDLAVTYSSQACYYFKLGRLVHIWGDVSASAFTHSTASSNFMITGCPYTPEFECPIHLSNINASFSWPASRTQIEGRMVSSSSNIFLAGLGTGAARQSLTTSNVASGGTPQVIFSGFLRTAS